MLEAPDLSQHTAMLEACLRNPDVERERLRGFVERFVRPHGIDRPATPHVVAAIETLGEVTPAGIPARTSAGRSERPSGFSTGGCAPA